MGYCDFVVKYDPKKDSSTDVAERILYSLFISRLKAKKPAVAFIGGDSGEGKSHSAINLQEILMRIQGLEFKDYLNDMNVYVPLEYPKKMRALLEDKRLKKANIITIHEAREIINAKDWSTFVNRAVADVNALSRQVKRMCFFIVSQFIKDISTDIRYTLNYYITVRRPKGKRARLYLSVMWKDDRDLEKPKLQKRKVSGYLVYPNGRYQRYVPQYLELPPLDKEVARIFDKADFDAKSRIMRTKLDQLMKQMSKDIGYEDKKLEAMVDYYVDNRQSLPSIGRQLRGKWRLKPEARDMHELTIDESREFEKRLNEKLTKVIG